jgi:cobalamin biosynthesis protein CbiM
MHIPDGYIDATTSVAAGAVAIAGVALCLRGARKELDEKTAPMAGLVAATIFAFQMINFPVAGGTSGHLLGGALAAILVGPYTGALCVSVVLIVQSLLFADGGVSALGLNIINMALVTVLVGWFTFRLVLKVLPKTHASVVIATAVGAFLSVPAAALAFTLEYAIGGTADISMSTVLTAMVSVHVLIGIGEAIISAAVVAAVLKVRPDLVYGARGIAAPLELHATPAVS